MYLLLSFIYISFSSLSQFAVHIDVVVIIIEEVPCSLLFIHWLVVAAHLDHFFSVDIIYLRISSIYI